MTHVMILGESGKAASKAEVSDELAGQVIKSHLIHETVVAELAARRSGTASTRTRGQARGGGRKPWRQKGTGRARQGSIRAPQWTGGGVAFGPTPRPYAGKVNRKVRRQAFLGALRAHVERETLALMDPTGWTEPSTKRAAEYLRAAPERIGERPLLVCLDDPDGPDGRAFRNLRGVDVMSAGDVETADLLSYRALLVERSAWEAMAGELGNAKRVTAKDSGRSAGEAEDERWAAGAAARAARAEAQAEYAARRQAEREEQAEQAAAAAAAVAALAGAGTEPEVEEADAGPDAEEPETGAPEDVEDGTEADASASDAAGEVDEPDDVDEAEDADESADEDVVISDEELEAEALAAGEAEGEDEDVVISDEELEAEALAAGEAEEIADEEDAEESEAAAGEDEPGDEEGTS